MDAPAPQQPLPPAQTAKEQGDIPTGSEAASSGQARVLLSPTGQPLARDHLGRLYNPAKGPPPDPKDTREGGKAQRTVLLDSHKSADDNDLEQRGPRIGGLSEIPEVWPQLPNNASLSGEIAWVLAERLRVVKELPRGGFKVDLSKARVPAPSMAALSWLDTAIRTPTKFADLAAKQASSGQDEAEFVRRERMQIVEIRALLEEMRVDRKQAKG